MKLAVAIADAKAGPSAFVVWRGFSESMRKAAEYGYDGVELALRTREDVDKVKLYALLKQYNLQVSCVSTGQTFADLGLYLTNPDQVRRQEAIDTIAGLVELASEYDGGRMVNLGRSRGFIDQSQTPQEAADLFLDSVDKLLPKAQKLGVTIIVEPVNRYEINFVNTVGQGAQLLSGISYPNIGLMPDVFHMNIEDASIGGSLREHGSLVRYIHLADSNRHAPGQGHLDFDEVFHALQDICFDGWASIEILPVPDPDTAARQAADCILPKIRAYNQQLR